MTDGGKETEAERENETGGERRREEKERGQSEMREQ